MKITDNLAAIAGFVRSVAGDLPDPASISVYESEFAAACLMFDSLDDLREWAAYFEMAPSMHIAKATGRAHYMANMNFLGSVFEGAYLESADEREARETADSLPVPDDELDAQWADVEAGEAFVRDCESV